MPYGVLKKKKKRLIWYSPYSKSCKAYFIPPQLPKLSELIITLVPFFWDMALALPTPFLNHNSSSVLYHLSCYPQSTCLPFTKTFSPTLSSLTFIRLELEIPLSIHSLVSNIISLFVCHGLLNIFHQLVKTFLFFLVHCIYHSSVKMQLSISKTLLFLS